MLLASFLAKLRSAVEAEPSHNQDSDSVCVSTYIDFDVIIYWDHSPGAGAVTISPWCRLTVTDQLHCYDHDPAASASVARGPARRGALRGGAPARRGELCHGHLVGEGLRRRQAGQGGLAGVSSAYTLREHRERNVFKAC